MNEFFCKQFLRSFTIPPIIQSTFQSKLCIWLVAVTNQTHNTAGFQYNSDDVVLLILIYINGMTVTVPNPAPHIPPLLKRLHDALHCAHWISGYNPSWLVYQPTDMHPASQLLALRLCAALKQEIYEHELKQLWLYNKKTQETPPRHLFKMDHIK